MSQEENGAGQTQNQTVWVPDTYIIIFFVVLLAAISTAFIPVGQFDTREVTFEEDGEEQTQTVLDPDSFRLVTGENGEPETQFVGLFQPGGETGLLNYVFEGLVSGDKFGSAVGVVAFILVIGGAFGVILRTGAIETGMLSVIDRLRQRAGLIIPVLFFLFSLGGAVFGMGEEAIAFALILVPIVIALGYDSITGVMITYGATQIGFAASWMNPFGVAIAQGIAGVPVLSGSGFRFATWVMFTVVGIVYIYIYARRVRRNPESSLAYASDEYFRQDFKEEEHQSSFGLGQALVLITIALGLAWVIWGVVTQAYFIPEIASQFFTIGLVCGIIGIAFRLEGMDLNGAADAFKKGAQDLLPAALVVGMAKGILIILGGDDPSVPTVMNTVLDTVAGWIDGLAPALAAWFMLVFQTVFNFFIVSGTGQAALTMPLLAPLSDLVGVTRQVAVLAYQYGDGFTNMIIPTSGALMGTLGAARLDWATWFRFAIKFNLLLFVLASIVVVFAQLIGFS